MISSEFAARGPSNELARMDLIYKEIYFYYGTYVDIREQPHPHSSLKIVCTRTVSRPIFLKNIDLFLLILRGKFFMLFVAENRMTRPLTNH